MNKLFAIASAASMLGLASSANAASHGSVSVGSNIHVSGGGVIVINGARVGGPGSGSHVEGAGAAVSDKRALPAWDRLVVEGSIEVEFARGPAADAEIVAQSNILPLVRAEVSGGVLRVFASGSFSSSERVKARLTAPRLRSVEIKGSGSARAVDIQEADFSAMVAGSGDIKLSGRVDSLAARVMGSGDVRARKLQAKKVDAQVMGSGDVEVTATEAVSAVVMGSGDIRVHGEPAERDVRKMGSGEVEFE